MTGLRYRDFNSYLRESFGGRVQKITVDAGFTCPNRDGTKGYGGCIYCNPRGSGTGAHALGQSVTQQLEAGKERLYQRYKATMFLAYFQSFTNTYGPLDRLREVYDQAAMVPGVVGMCIGTRPDCVPPEVLDLLGGYTRTHDMWIEYGIQSVHDRTLARINRGHDYACFESAVTGARERNIKVCAHIILGLPGESREEMLASASVLGDLGVDGVKIHLLYVVKGTPLDSMYAKGEYRCLEQREYAELVCDYLERVPKDMVIQRITGDPHPHELVAPDWALRKMENRNLIHRILEERDAWQGDLYSRRP